MDLSVAISTSLPLRPLVVISESISFLCSWILCWEIHLKPVTSYTNFSNLKISSPLFQKPGLSCPHESWDHHFVCLCFLIIPRKILLQRVLQKIKEHWTYDTACTVRSVLIQGKRRGDGNNSELSINAFASKVKMPDSRIWWFTEEMAEFRSQS